jgi:two-component system sensor histidine kinase/response regulator
VLDTPLDRYQREYLETAKTSAYALLGLLNDILDFSKMEAGKLELEATTFSLHACVGGMKALGTRADQKGLELTADIPGTVPDHLIGYPMRLRQILINLIDNAINRARGRDAARQSRIRDRRKVLSAFFNNDTGVGILPAKQALIFEAFTQADGSTTRTHGGTGLGLAIAAQPVGQMNGGIWIKSALDTGTTFHFTAQFPVGDTASPIDESRNRCCYRAYWFLW